MIDFKALEIPGVFLVENFVATDERGIFVKTFHEEIFRNIDFNGHFKESYYSRSYKNVIRGMHFQIPPADHEKLVYVTSGKILDVVLDIRAQSPAYGKFLTVELNEFGSSVFIPKGCAHGFLTLSDEATVVYNVSTVYNRDADSGILWNTFGYNWPIDDQPVVSKRDSEFIDFDSFITPFQ